MILSALFTLTIFIALIFFLSEKKLTFIENAIVFMGLAIITRNYHTIMTMVLKMVKTSEEHQLFIALLLNREIITPVLVLLFINGFLVCRKWKKRGILFLFMIGFLQALDMLLVHTEVIRYIKWNVYYACVVNVFYLLVGLGIAILLKYISKQESLKYDHRL